MKEQEPIKIEGIEGKQEITPISREHFVMAISDQIESWEKEGLHAQLQKIGLQNILRKLFQAEALEMKTSFWIEEKTIISPTGEERKDIKYRFEAREKGKFGFRGVVKNNETCPENSEEGRSSL